MLIHVIRLKFIHYYWCLDQNKEFIKCSFIKVRKRTKIWNRYNQGPHLTQHTDGKMTISQLDVTNESQEVGPFTAGDHKASINRRTRTNSKIKTEIINDQQRLIGLLKCICPMNLQTWITTTCNDTL